MCFYNRSKRKACEEQDKNHKDTYPTVVKINFSASEREEILVIYDYAVLGLSTFSCIS